MSGIGAVGGYSASYSAYSVAAGGGALQSAAQDASGLAIQERTEAQTRALDQGTENMGMARSVLNIEDGALEGIADYLKSIKELAVQAKNDLLSSEERGYIQGQIDQYMQGINDLANGTTFNEQHLLDGSNGNFTVSSDGSGSSVNVSAHDSTVASLGIANFDVTSGNFNLDDIDNALNTVQQSRTTVGAESNRIDFATNYNTRASLELNGFSMDRDEERMMKSLQDVKTQQALDQYQLMLQKKQQEDEQQKSRLFFA